MKTVHHNPEEMNHTAIEVEGEVLEGNLNRMLLEVRIVYILKEEIGNYEHGLLLEGEQDNTSPA